MVAVVMVVAMVVIVLAVVQMAKLLVALALAITIGTGRKNFLNICPHALCNMWKRFIAQHVSALSGKFVPTIYVKFAKTLICLTYDCIHCSHC